MKQVVKTVLEKKELSNVSPKIIKKIIKENLTKEVRGLIHEKRFKTKKFKSFVKLIRAQLRRQFGVFQNPKINRTELIKDKNYIDLLKSHLSSNERLPYYSDLYEKIFRITGSPRSILDIGCGMNPISFEFMNLKNVKYLACDISPSDMNIIETYFRQRKIKGSVRVFDAVRDEYDFKKFDIVFAFKLFEILETTKSHRLTEDIVKNLKFNYLVASFNTRTISGIPMTRKRRVWFEVMTKRLGYKFKTIMIPNELFYVIKK